MLQNFRVQGFKRLRDLHITDLSRVTLIGGKNNVGKTSLLEAIFLMYDTADPGMFFRHLGWRGLEAPLTDAEALFAPVFTHFDIKQEISFEVVDGKYQASMRITFDLSPGSLDIPTRGDGGAPLRTDTVTGAYRVNLLYQIVGGMQDQVSLVGRHTATNMSIQFEPHPVSVIPSDMQRPVIFFPLRLRPDSNEDARRFSQLDINRKIDRVITFLRIIEPQLVGLSSLIFPQSPTIYADIQGMQRKVPVALLGDGMSTLLSLILAIASARNGIVLIDEIDSGLHYTILPTFWESLFGAAREFRCQVIATTHSYECLRAAYEGAAHAHTERDFGYIRLETRETDIVARQYAHAVLGAALEQGWEVR
ncbi:MAG TPA: ATP-binding protein [Ktedonobacteraceae bacterium]